MCSAILPNNSDKVSPAVWRSVTAPWYRRQWGLESGATVADWTRSGNLDRWSYYAATLSQRDQASLDKRARIYDQPLIGVK